MTISIWALWLLCSGCVGLGFILAALMRANGE